MPRTTGKVAVRTLQKSALNGLKSSAADSRRTSPGASRDESSRDASHDEDDEDTPPAKKRKIASRPQKKGINPAFTKIFEDSLEQSDCVPPARTHSLHYHRPLLLAPTSGRQGQDALLSWFDSVAETRSMPWRKSWIDPKSVEDPAGARSALERRAYEVWISEIMLQQTRVAVVIDYWNRWMAQWPTIQDLAKADAEDVLAAWRGLGYYSRATRIHEAAKLVVNDPNMRGLLPEDVKELEAKVPGVGRYTAGAICSIVFGRPEPMVDGNVLRVLSRQLGLLGNVKSDKTVIDLLWMAADKLVKDVARSEGDDVVVSDRPGRWGQGLMELGSTICTPKPNCSACPVTSTCRAYQEGMALATSKDMSKSVDIEDVCELCAPFEEAVEEDDGEKKNAAAKQDEVIKPVVKAPRQATLAAFAFTRKSNSNGSKPEPTETKPKVATSDIIANHAKKFPLKVIKKAVREEETLVCAIRSSDGHYLIHRRPEKGLLAGLWELPSHIIDAGLSSGDRKKAAKTYVSTLLEDQEELRHVADLGSVPWLFSHLKLTMHVHLFELEGSEQPAVTAPAGKLSRWSEDVESESMGTGMRKCWALVNDSAT